uniref:Uncharacterized protein n=1 Tax=Anguilla anguilla TaxID=7936 RepID=A0A0E9R8K4_ANGAN
MRHIHKESALLINHEGYDLGESLVRVSVF